ncbi:fimbrial protein [Rahnella inusitata]|uniref:fimbrial protein n=1 Tax=Rahnella inusitata TaxID=58169 RepID=UPI0039B08F6E
MTFKKTATLLGCILSVLCTQSVMAADSTINITATIVASPCTVDTASKNLSINLGDIQASTLAAANVGSPWVNGTIKLTNCPSTTSQVVATFTGTADTNAAFAYKNTGTGSSAASVHVMDAAGSADLKNGATLTQTVTSGAAAIPFKVRVYTSKGSVTPGAISAAISVAFTYK